MSDNLMHEKTSFDLMSLERAYGVKGAEAVADQLFHEFTHYDRTLREAEWNKWGRMFVMIESGLFVVHAQRDISLRDYCDEFIGVGSYPNVMKKVRAYKYLSPLVALHGPISLSRATDIVAHMDGVEPERITERYLLAQEADEKTWKSELAVMRGKTPPDG